MTVQKASKIILYVFICAFSVFVIGQCDRAEAARDYMGNEYVEVTKTADGKLTFFVDKAHITMYLDGLRFRVEYKVGNQDVDETWFVPKGKDGEHCYWVEERSIYNTDEKAFTEVRHRVSIKKDNVPDGSCAKDIMKYARQEYLDQYNEKQKEMGGVK